MRLEQSAKRLKATIPTQGSKLYQVLWWLVIGKQLTVPKALRLCKTTELRKHVCRLRDYGWPIKDKWVKEGGDRFKVYWV